MKSCYIFLLIVITIGLSFSSCEKARTVDREEGINCEYDTDCRAGLSCINDVCTISSYECKINSDCDEKCDTPPCKCKMQECVPYNPCDITPCKDEYKTKCEQTDIKEDNYYNCICDDGYEDKSGVCKFICDEFSTINETNDGCTCNTGYELINNKCVFTCETIHSHTNETNDGCVCDDNYSPVGAECLFDCSDIYHSHLNSTNDGCICDDNYFDSFEHCCTLNSTYNTTSNSCKCDNNYYQDGNSCKEKTPCLNPDNPCTDSNKTICEVVGDSYKCKCDENYHEDNGICCPKFFHNEANSCVGDYDFCNNDNDCTNDKVCSIHVLDGELYSYCGIKNVSKNPVAAYCVNDADCESGMCSVEGYCIQLCSSDRTVNPCSGVTCSGVGVCEVDSINNLPVCNCEDGKIAQGDKCITPVAGVGNECGGGILITKSGYYHGDMSEGYTNNYNSVGTCDERATDGTEMVFKLVLDSSKLVTLELIAENTSIFNTTIYTKRSCNGAIEKCSPAGENELDPNSKIKEVFEAGTHYIFVDTSEGRMNRDNFELKVIILDLGSCPKGTDCTLKDITMDEATGSFQVCYPKEELNSGLITRCYKDTDCETGKHCKFDALGTNDPARLYAGCIARQNSTCTPGFLKYPDGTNGYSDFCCMGLYANNICNEFCVSTLDCPTGYNCETFSANLGGNSYSSVSDNYKECEEKGGFIPCGRDSDCTDSSIPYCSLKDNGDGRILKACSKRSGFDKNEGESCMQYGHNECYNYICYRPNFNNSTGDPTCVSSCEFDNDCVNSYKCLPKTIAFPLGNNISNPSIKCDNISSQECITDLINVCIKTEEFCTNYDSCGSDFCVLKNNQSLYFACSEANDGATKNLGETCTRSSDCKSALCFGETGNKYCSTKCDTDCGTLNCEQQTIIYAGRSSVENICVKP